MVGRHRLKESFEKEWCFVRLRILLWAAGEECGDKCGDIQEVDEAIGGEIGGGALFSKGGNKGGDIGEVE